MVDQVIQLFEATPPDDGAGIVDQNVQPAELLHMGIDHPAHVALSATSPWSTAAPMPVLAPVISTDLPLSSSSIGVSLVAPPLPRRGSARRQLRRLPIGAGWWSPALLRNDTP
jgi:hypothetical protein